MKNIIISKLYRCKYPKLDYLVYVEMILKMKKAVHFIIGMIICLLVSISCQKTANTDILTDAIITGYDLRDCICCGGLMVSFVNNPIPYSGEFYLVNNLPKDSGIDNNSKFPLYVKISWRDNSRVCGGTKFIDIQKLEIK